MDKKLSRLTTEQRYELVSYLDGELDEEATARIEKLIAENAVARQDVELLAATYALFDDLPRPKAKPGFTEKTVSMAKLESVRPDVTQSPVYRLSQRAIPYIGWIAVMCVAGLVGYSTTRFWLPLPIDPLVENLPVIRELDKYAEVGSIDFLQQLRGNEAVLRELRGESSATQAE